MFVKKKAYDNAIQKVRVEFGTLLGLETEAEAFMVLKELPTLEMMELNEAKDKGGTELLKYFKSVLPNIIVEHNLYETESDKMTNKAVIDFVFEKTDLTVKIIHDYTNAAFFTRLNKTEDK